MGKSRPSTDLLICSTFIYHTIYLHSKLINLDKSVVNLNLTYFILAFSDINHINKGVAQAPVDSSRTGPVAGAPQTPLKKAYHYSHNSLQS